LVAWLTLSVLPWANQNIEEIRHAQKSETNITNMTAGRFTEFSRGDLVFYVEGMLLDNRMHNVFVQNRQHGKVGLITAEEGHQYEDEKTGDRYIVLERGYRYQGLAGQSDYSVSEFEKYAVRIVDEEAVAAQLRRRSLPSTVLMKSGSIKDRAEFQYRLAFPLAVIVFTLVSVPLSRSSPRQGIYGRLFIAFLVYFTFFNLLGVSGTWMEDGITPEWVGRWWVHMLMLTMVLPLVLRDSMWAWALKRWWMVRRTA
jgi:lipopolysaccharide export system permease protein